MIVCVSGKYQTHTTLETHQWILGNKTSGSSKHTKLPGEPQLIIFLFQLFMMTVPLIVPFEIPDMSDYLKVTTFQCICQNKYCFSLFFCFRYVDCGTTIFFISLKVTVNYKGQTAKQQGHFLRSRLIAEGNGSEVNSRVQPSPSISRPCTCTRVPIT